MEKPTIKLRLEDIQVESFVTSKIFDAKTAKGGFGFTAGYTHCGGCESDAEDCAGLDTGIVCRTLVVAYCPPITEGCQNPTALGCAYSQVGACVTTPPLLGCNPNATADTINYPC